MVVLLNIIAGIALMMAFMQLMVQLNKDQRDKTGLFYAFSILTIPPYVFLTSQIYQATTVDSIIDILRIQMCFTPILIICYTRFVAYYTGIIHKKFLTFTTILFLPLPLIRFFSPYLLTYKDPIAVKTVITFWGDKLNSLAPQMTLFGLFYFIIFVLIFLYICCLGCLYWIKKGNRGLSFFTIQILILLGLINDILVDSLHLNWVYLGEFALSLTVLFMGVHLFQDMLEGLRLKNALEQREKELSQLIQSSGAALFSLDVEGNFLLFNQEFSRLCKLEKKDLTSQNYQSLSDNVLLKPIIHSIEEILSYSDEKDQITNQISITGEDKREEHYQVTLVSTGDHKTGAVGIITDISELNYARDQLSRTEKMKAIGQLAGGIAHDFNNMLTGIIGTTDLLLDTLEDTPKEVHELAEQIITTAEGAATLTNKLLQFSRKKTNAKEVCNLNLLMKDSLVLLKRSIPKTVQIDFQSTQKDLQVYADKGALQSIILNIGINAVHAMNDKGNLTIKLGEKYLDKYYCKMSAFPLHEGSYVKLSIKDNGTGIEKENLDRIFDPYFTTKEQGKGTGLGLSTAFGSISDHKGEILAFSEPGDGAEFVIYLPLITDL